MKKTLSCDDFLYEVSKYENRRGQFSREGLKALFDYIVMIEEDTGEETELDFIALCCDFTEYKNLKEIQENCNDIETLEDLEDRTQVIEIEDTDRIIIRDF